MQAIEYWFRLLDNDGDGVLSFYELEHAYGFIKQSLLSAGVEPMNFTDVLCQVRVALVCNVKICSLPVQLLDAIDHAGDAHTVQQSVMHMDAAAREQRRREQLKRGVKLVDLKRVRKQVRFCAP